MSKPKPQVRLSADGKEVVISVGGHESTMGPEEVLKLIETLRKLGIEIRENRMSPGARELLRNIRRTTPPY